MESLAARSGVEIVHVPYRGSGAAVTAVLSGEVDMALLPAAAVMPHVKSGKIKALAVASAKRSSALPDLSTLSGKWNGRHSGRCLDRLHRSREDAGSYFEEAA